MRAAVANGSIAFNGGEIYGTPERNSLQLLSEYFTKYPEDADKVVLSIKGGCIPGTMAEPDGSRKNVSRSIDECLKVLDSKKSLDLFEVARLDPKVPVEETVSTIAEYIKAGKVGGLSLSEVNANTIRKIHAMHPVAAVEAEFSLWSTDILENGVAETCGELGIPIVAYSPLGRGFLVRPPPKSHPVRALLTSNRPDNSRSTRTSPRLRYCDTCHASSPTSSTRTSSCCAKSRRLQSRRTHPPVKLPVVGSLLTAGGTAWVISCRSREQRQSRESRKTQRHSSLVRKI
jgi:aryl-alcohol dehydrogenase-like predicted oxidoreductase